MPIDRKHIFDKINFFLKRENKFFTSSEILLSINDAFKRIAEDIDYPKTHYSTYVASGAWQISTPANFLKLDKNSQVTYESVSGSINALKPKLQTDIGRDVILTQAPGTPESYFEENEAMLGLYPASTSGCLVVPYVKAPTNLSSDTDTNELTEHCYMAAAWWVVSECMLKDNDQRFETYSKNWQAELNRLRRRFGNRFEQDHNLNPHPTYARNY